MKWTSKACWPNSTVLKRLGAQATAVTGKVTRGSDGKGDATAELAKARPAAWNQAGLIGFSGYQTSISGLRVNSASSLRLFNQASTLARCSSLIEPRLSRQMKP